MDDLSSELSAAASGALSTAVAVAAAALGSHTGFLPHTLTVMDWVPAGALLFGGFCGCGLYIRLRRIRRVPGLFHHLLAAALALAGWFSIYRATYRSFRDETRNRHHALATRIRGLLDTEEGTAPEKEPAPAGESPTAEKMRKLTVEYRLSQAQHQNAVRRYNAYLLSHNGVEGREGGRLKAAADRTRKRFEGDAWRLKQFQAAASSGAARSAPVGYGPLPPSERLILAERRQRLEEMLEITFWEYLRESVGRRERGRLAAARRVPQETPPPAGRAWLRWLRFLLEMLCFPVGSVGTGLYLFGWRWGRSLVFCPGCGRILRAPKRSGKLKVRCPACRRTVGVSG